MKKIWILGFLCIVGALIFVYERNQPPDYALSGIDITANYGKDSRYHLVRSPNGRGDIIDRSKKIDSLYWATLESDYYDVKEYLNRLFVRGFEGFTIIDLENDKIKQYRTNWGPGSLGPATTPEVLLSIYGKHNYSLLTEYDQFTAEEQEVFRSIKSDREGWHKKAYSEKLIIPAELKIVAVFPEKKSTWITQRNGNRLIQLKLKGVLEFNVLSYRKEQDKIYFLGEYNDVLYDKKKREVIRYTHKVYNWTTGEEFLLGEKNGSDDLKIKVIKDFQEFSPEDQRIFLEMKENPEKYKAQI